MQNDSNYNFKNQTPLPRGPHPPAVSTTAKPLANQNNHGDRATHQKVHRHEATEHQTPLPMTSAAKASNGQVQAGLRAASVRVPGGQSRSNGAPHVIAAGNPEADGTSLMAAPLENSPKSATVLKELPCSETGSSIDMLVCEEESEGSVCSDSGDWEVVDEAKIAIDYSNVHVFLKTLHELRKRKTQWP